MTRKKKAFDCVEMQHQGGDAIYARLSKMTREEQIAYWQQRTEELRELVESARRKRQAVTP
jgi:hypothetical protein